MADSAAQRSHHAGKGRLAWPPWAATALLLALTGAGVWRAVRLNGGHLSYPIDDAYGHAAIAKNLVRHGVWGFTAADGFASAGSSLAWPLLIAAGYAVFGVNVWTPLALNGLAAAGLIFYLAAALRRFTASRLATFAVLAAAVVLAPLPALVASGMEHTLQTWLCVAFAFTAARWLAGEMPRRALARWPLPVLAALLVATRYEGLFLVGVVGLALGARRYWGLAVTVGAAAAVPVTSFGLFSVSRGWYFLPNSLLLKGSAPQSWRFDALRAYTLKGYEQLLANPHLLFLTLALLAALLAGRHRGRPSRWTTAHWLLGWTLAAMAIHLQLASTGWFYRYEAYLVVLGLFSLGVALLAGAPAVGRAHYWRQPRAWPHLAALAAAAVLFGGPLWSRATESRRLLAPACHNVFEQQVQMANFLREFYPGAAVAANDVMAISFFADIRLVDTFGLVSREVARAKRAGAYDQEVLRRLLAEKGVRVIVVYDAWAGEYGGQLPEWVPVGRWTIPHNVICGSETVSFYAPNAGLADELTRALQAFAPRLPADVVQDGPYRGGPPPPVLGTYDLETDPSGPFRWTSRGARFTLPATPSPPSGTSRLEFAVRPLTPGQRLEVFVNDQLVQTETFTPGQTDAWVPLSVQAPWREGTNTLLLLGQGQPVHPPYDGRKLLFGLREPRWVAVADPDSASTPPATNP